MLLLSGCIPLCNQLVLVTHWQRLVTRKISIKEWSTYKDFRRHINFEFSEEIDADGRNPPTFRIYTLPAGFNDVEDRRLVNDDTTFEKLRNLLMNDSVSHPQIYVWNYDNVSPAKLPQNVAQAKSDTGSAVSRDSNAAENCKSRDLNRRLCCGYVGRDGFGMECCHIYEVGAFNRIKMVGEREKELKDLQLVTIDELANMITLCKDCHNKFDAHKLGIHSTEHTWIVTNLLRGDGAVAQSNTCFIDIHPKKVPFAATRFISPKEVLDDRMSHFVTSNSPNHYCHFCLHVCTNEVELKGHIQGCGATALPKSFSGLSI